MQVKAKVLAAGLKRLGRWIEQLKPQDLNREETRNRVEDTVVGCLDLLDYSPTTDMVEWRGRMPRRRRLDDPCRAVLTRDGKRAIDDLIQLTISELLACEAFQPEVYVGVIPVRPPVEPSAAQLQALQRGRAQHNQAIKDHRRCIEKRLELEAKKGVLQGV
jgi:hypothetical protein